MENYPEHPSSYRNIEQEVDQSNWAKKINKYIQYIYILSRYFDLSNYYNTSSNGLSSDMEFEELIYELQTIYIKILDDLIEQDAFKEAFDSIRNMDYSLDKLSKFANNMLSIFYVRKNKEQIPTEQNQIVFNDIEIDGYFSYKPIDTKRVLELIKSGNIV